MSFPRKRRFTMSKAVLGFAFCLLTAPLAVAQYNTAWAPASTNANVGIGTASPAAKLQVAGGSIFVTGDSGALATSAGAGLALKYYNDNALIFGYDYSTSLFKNLALQLPGGNVTIGMIGNLSSPSTNARVIVAQGDGATGL